MCAYFDPALAHFYMKIKFGGGFPHTRLNFAGPMCRLLYTNMIDKFTQKKKKKNDR